MSREAVLDAKPYLTAWRLWLGEIVLTCSFATFLTVFA
jgi:hypothetical protein